MTTKPRRGYSACSGASAALIRGGEPPEFEFATSSLRYTLEVSQDVSQDLAAASPNFGILKGCSSALWTTRSSTAPIWLRQFGYRLAQNSAATLSRDKTSVCREGGDIRLMNIKAEVARLAALQYSIRRLRAGILKHGQTHTSVIERAKQCQAKLHLTNSKTKPRLDQERDRWRAMPRRSNRS